MDRLLIVEDDDDLREILIEFIRGELKDVEVFQARDGREGLELVRQMSHDRQFNLILSDIKMPRMTGMELLSNLRAEGFPTTFVVLTGFADKESIIQALRLGAFDFLEKPFDRRNLMRVLREGIDFGRTIEASEEQITVQADERGLKGEERERFARAQRLVYIVRNLGQRAAGKKAV
jgi:YesN/AraC family two-component response regulator